MAIEDAETLAGHVLAAPGQHRRGSRRLGEGTPPAHRPRRAARRVQPLRLACRRAGRHGAQCFPAHARPGKARADLDWLYGWEPPTSSAERRQLCRSSDHSSVCGSGFHQPVRKPAFAQRPGRPGVAADQRVEAAVGFEEAVELAIAGSGDHDRPVRPLRKARLR